ncbi:MAG TPA: class I SAM-dependent methyltransferase [Bryobacteraceae bacterium]|nr:class I SAM-dependent methyltransferase [Bryobacteraceae bacterium]
MAASLTGQIDLQAIAPNLELGHGGFWRSATVSSVSYPEDGNELCFSVEDSSFWFRHRNRCILDVLRLFPPPGTFFDVGGGNGFVASAIPASGQDVVLVEPGLSGVRNAIRRGVRQVVQATLEDAGILPGTLPGVGLFDVVEHIEDDRGFLKGICRLVKAGGLVYITVPAYQWLWSSEDVVAGHARRYTIPSLSRVLEEVGYSVEFATYFFSFLPLPILARRALPYRLGISLQRPAAETIQSDHETSSVLVGRVLNRLMERELATISARRPLKMGGSCLVVARRRG